MKKVLAIVIATFSLFGLCLVASTTYATETETTTEETTYEMTTIDLTLVSKFVEKLNTIIDEKGDSFKHAVLAFIYKILEKPDVEPRVAAIFGGIAEGLEGTTPEDPTGTGTNDEPGTGSNIGTGTNDEPGTGSNIGTGTNDEPGTTLLT